VLARRVDVDDAVLDLGDLHGVAAYDDRPKSADPVPQTRKFSTEGPIMPIVLDHNDLAEGLLAEYESLAQLSESLDDAAWRTPTRCTGWEVRDAIGHVAALGADAAAGNPGSRTADEQAAAMRDHTPAEIATHLRATIVAMRALMEMFDDAAWDAPLGNVPGLTLAQGVQALWHDAYAHGEDARAALGMAADRGPGLAASVAFLAFLLEVRGWGPATLALDGLPAHDIGGGGMTVTGDPHQFVLVAEGRADPAALGLDASVNVYA
jgi:uncharacterized protein (TIGR03083 family)